MLKRLKQSVVGKTLYRFLPATVITALRYLAKALQHHAIDIRHFKAQNRTHNQNQIKMLQKFEQQLSITKEQ